jgi:cytochrome c biogenesis protein CcmG/thiol:disulfide interchange protein DsbE
MSNQVSENPPKQGRSWVFVPVLIFAGLAVIFMTGLRGGDPSKLPSALINQPAPTFDLPALEGLTIDGVAVPGLASNSLAQGRITLVNVWASWCGPCREEHPQLMELAKRDDIDLAGLNYKDQRENALRFLNALGNPYSGVGVDTNGRTSVDWGVYGVPETFVINAKGTIVYKFTGPITSQALREAVIPAIEKARQP